MSTRRVGLSLALASAAVAAGCRVPITVDTRPGLAPRCADSVCVEVVHFGSHEPAVGLWLDAPPTTRLVNAHFTIDDEPACGGHSPVAWVRVDQQLHRFGPVDVGGAHGLVLGFPFDAWWAHWGYWRDTFVDLELDVGGQARCVRAALTRDAKVAGEERP